MIVPGRVVDVGLSPLGCNCDHQDYDFFLVGDSRKPEVGKVGRLPETNGFGH